MMDIAKKLAKKLRNIGPIMAQKLVKAGIETPEKLHKVGAVEAYLRIHQTGGFCGKFHITYLYALEGAILDCDWKEIPYEKKEIYQALIKLWKTN